jgi:NAD(P)-dependent dehydrogenase (short-subunit alcohol dehydrogenase family)
MGRLENKVAMITGCRRGFGKAFAELFAKEGAAVSICDIVSVEELWDEVGSGISVAGGKVICFQTDVSQEDQVNAMVKETIDTFGTLDILVNNVGISGPTRSVWEITLDEWNRTLMVNLGGTFLCTKAAVPEMIRKKDGRIINLSSILGKIPIPYRTPYAVTKMGVIGFTRVLALEVGKYNITANSICPSSPGGERNVELARDLSEYLGKTFDAEDIRKSYGEESDDKVLGGMHLRNEGYLPSLISHKDVADLALFLVSDEASNITGQDINVTAGTVMW